MVRRFVTGVLAVLAVIAPAPLAVHSAHAQLGGAEALYPWPEDPTNLVANPSFEVDVAGQPADWTIGLPAFLFPDASASHSGAVSLHLRDSHLAPFYPLATQTVSAAPGWYNLRGWGKAVAAGTNNPGAGGRLSFWGTGASTPVVRDTTDWTLLEQTSILVPPGISPTLRIEAYGKPDGDIFFDDIALHRQIPPVVEWYFLYPNYRGVLFEDEPQTIQVSIAVHPEEVGLTLADLVVRFVLETTTGKVIATRDVSPPAARFVFSVDISGLPRGDFRARLRALRARDGQLLFEYPPYHLVKLSVAQRARLTAYVDADNVLVLNGRRTFALGIYDTTGYSNLPSAYEPRIAKIAEAPFNLYLNYWLAAAPASALNALMVTLQKYDMAYLHTANSWYDNHPDWPGATLCRGKSATTLGEDEFTACMAGELASNPVLAGWYTADEQRANQAARVFHQYTILRANDLDGVAFIAQNLPEELSRWRDAADVVGVDPYPIFNIPAGQLAPLEMVTDWVGQAQAAVEGSRPVWAVIQFFQFGSKGHWPTYDELRSMSYMAIVAGAKGLFYWSYGARGLAWVTDAELKEEYWQRLVRLTQEIKALEPALLSADAPGLLQAHAPAGDIRVLAKQVGKTRYLIAVNNTPQPLTASFTLSATVGRVEAVGEGRSGVLNATSFFDFFGPYAVHVYKLEDLWLEDP
ncbi:MAG: hypothetical protein HY613_05105 [Candidatus Rokubacteria bacterium]|nr:hypothetical protein [Candidatus Rokubacteria bacterium]